MTDFADTRSRLPIGQAAESIGVSGATLERCAILSMFRRGDDDMARRRGQRTGHVYRKGPSWLCRWREDVRSAAGIVERHKFCQVIAPAEGPKALTKKQAARVAWEQILSKLDTMTLRPQSLATISEFVSARFEPDIVEQCKRSGQIHYRYLLGKYVLPAIGKLRLRDLTPDNVQRLIGGVLKARLSAQTAAHVRKCIAAIFHHAKRLRFYSGDLPTEGVRIPKSPATERRSLTWDQARELIQQLPAPLRLVALLLATTGLRIGEACGLRWKHVRFDAGVIQIRENWVRNRRATLKSRAALRDVPMPRAVGIELRALAAVSRWNAPEHPVFAARNGRPLDQHNTAARVLKPIARKLDLPWASWHCFRHTAASLADQVGLTVAERQKLLGHAGAGMTLHYTHTEAQRIREAVDTIADRLAAPFLPTLRPPERVN